MKYLWLDAHYDGARKVAECLIGSKVGHGDAKYYESGVLLGITSKFRFILDTSMHWEEMDTDEDYEILVPLDDMKVCPFVALRNDLEIVGRDSTFGEIWRGKVTQTIGHSLWIGAKRAYMVDTIQLNLAKLPKGCEVVERD